MTTIKDPIRQASLFTMGGLIDPRLMPEYSEDKIELQEQYTNINSSPSTFGRLRQTVEYFLKRGMMLR